MQNRANQLVLLLLLSRIKYRIIAGSEHIRRSYTSHRYSDHETRSQLYTFLVSLPTYPLPTFFQPHLFSSPTPPSHYIDFLLVARSDCIPPSLLLLNPAFFTNHIPPSLHARPSVALALRPPTTTTPLPRPSDSTLSPGSQRSPVINSAIINSDALITSPHWLVVSVARSTPPAIVESARTLPR